MEHAEQHHTLFYGIGKAVKELGPKAWQKRIQTAIDMYVIPHTTGKLKETIEAHKKEIAQVAGWTATGAEVAIVATVIYGGVKGIKKFRKGARPFPPSRVDSVLPSTVVDKAMPQPLTRLELKATAYNTFGPNTPKWLLAIIHPDRVYRPDVVSHKITSAPSKSDKVAQQMIGARHRWVMGAKHRPPIHVTDADVPMWLANLANPKRKTNILQAIHDQTPKRIRTYVIRAQDVARRAKKAERQARRKPGIQISKQTGYDEERARLRAKQAPVQEDYFKRVREAADRLAQPREPSNEPIVLPPESAVRDAIQSLRVNIFNIFHPARNIVRGEPSNEPIILPDK